MDDASLISPRNSAVAAGIVAIITGLRRSWPEFFAGRVGKRVLPLLPMALGVAAAFAGLCDMGDGPLLTWPSKAVVGVLTGTFASTLFKVADSTIAPASLSGTTSTAPPAPSPVPPPAPPPAPPTEPVAPSSEPTVPPPPPPAAPPPAPPVDPNAPAPDPNAPPNPDTPPPGPGG